MNPADVKRVNPHVTAEMLEGGTYENEYAWRFTCADGKVTRLDEFADTLNAFKQLGLLKN